VEALIDELRAVTDGLAHDLRSPLTRLKARIERLSLGTTVDADDLAAVSAEAESLLAMLDNSLEISRAEAGIGRDSFAEIEEIPVLRTGKLDLRALATLARERFVERTTP
jgi:signal transduction histidine kinase